MIDKLHSHKSFVSAKEALRSYRAARDELKRLGVIRSERSVTGDYGEWVVAQLLDLELAKNAVQSGYDATDSAGKTYQIKTRIVASPNAPTSFDMKLGYEPFDYLICVFFAVDCELLAVVRVDQTEVAARASVFRSRRSLRWTRKCWDEEWAEVLYRKATP